MQGEEKTADLQKKMMKLTHKTKWEGRERGMGWRQRMEGVGREGGRRGDKERENLGFQTLSSS